MNIDSAAIRRVRNHLLEYAPGPAANVRAAPAVAVVLRRLEPFAETMYLVMMADGAPADEERRAMGGALTLLSDGRISPDEIDAMLNRFERRAGVQGVEARLAEIGARFGSDRDDRETAFTLAAVTALADDRVDVRENRVLQSVQEYLGLSDRRVAALLESVD